MKTVSSCIPELTFECDAYPFWDFYADERELELRKQTRIGLITKAIGTRIFVRLLHCAHSVLNATSLLRVQGNKFFAIITKRGLQPWITQDHGFCAFRREYVNQA